MNIIGAYAKELMETILTEHEFRVLSLRYGFINKYNDVSKPKTLEEIAQILGVTRMAVCLVEKRALRKLKLVLNDEQIPKTRNLKK